MAADSGFTIQAPPGYCERCFSAAAKAGRPVRRTELMDWPICQLCEARIREGLVFYRPSNGTEFWMFYGGCERCRHWTDDVEYPKAVTSLAPPFVACTWGVLDRLLFQMCTPEDHASRWFDPVELRTFAPCGGAECLRHTPRDYGFGDRDPPPPVPRGQLSFPFADPLIVPDLAGRVTRAIGAVTRARRSPMVYVDALQPCTPTRWWRWDESCHLFADTWAELHEFAARLGLSHRWFQTKPGGVPHYDLTYGKRLQAVRMGATEVTRREAGQIFARIRRPARARS